MANREGILAIGNLLVDKTFRCNEYPKESMLTQISDINMSCGGGCTNVLFNLAKMDSVLPLELAGLIGNDEFGQFIIEQARYNNINYNRVQRVDNQVTSFTNVMINNQNGYRTFFHCMGVNSHFGAEYFQNLNSNARIAHVAYLLLLPALEQYDEEYGTASKRALTYLQNQGFKVSLDLVSSSEKSRYQEWVIPALSQVDYLIINDEEASQLTGIVIQENNKSSLAQYYEQAKILLDFGVRQRVYIHFPTGAVAVTKQGEQAFAEAYHIPVHNVISTLGAGDAFCAGALYGIHDGRLLSETLRLACASAHFNLYSTSATEGAVSLEKLQHFLDSYGY